MESDEIGVWRPSTGRFYLDADGSLTWGEDTDIATEPFGMVGDLPTIGDWNRDGIDEVGVWRASTGRFYLDVDGSGSWKAGVDVETESFGVTGDQPVAGRW